MPCNPKEGLVSLVQPPDTTKEINQPMRKSNTPKGIINADTVVKPTKKHSLIYNPFIFGGNTKVEAKGVHLKRKESSLATPSLLPIENLRVFHPNSPDLVQSANCQNYDAPNSVIRMFLSHVSSAPISHTAKAESVPF